MSQKEKISNFVEVIGGLKDTLSFLETLKDDYANFDSKIQQIENDKAELKKEKTLIETKLEEISKKLNNSTSAYDDLIIENKELKEDNKRMKSDLSLVSKELEKVSKDFEHLSKTKDKTIDMREVLALSMTLLVEVFGAQPHSKLLYLLHGQKSDMERSDLAKASGISPAMVRKALADLNAAKLVDYNVETGHVKLIKRIY
ncbi:MAG: hypothetical protein ACFFD2_09265 [Promethearchaeota archaeon]